MALLGPAAASVGKCAAASMRFQKDRSRLKEPPAFVARGSCFCGSGFPSWTADPLWVSWLACYGDITGPRSEVSLSGAESLEKGKTHPEHLFKHDTRGHARGRRGVSDRVPRARCRRASPRSSRFPTDASPAATAGPRPPGIRDARFGGELSRRSRVRAERGRGHDRAESRAPRARRHGAGCLRARVRARHHARRLGSVGRDGAGPERMARGVCARRARRARAVRRREARGHRSERPDAERGSGARGREPAAVPAVLGRARGGRGGAHPETTAFGRRT